MEKSSKRGKIPQQDWPSIISRYEAGETLASIARTYDCSPPAISYIVSRSRARSAAGEAMGHSVPATGEPQLVKASAPEIPVSGMAADDAPHRRAAIAEPLQLSVPATPPQLFEQPAEAARPAELTPFAAQTNSLDASHGRNAGLDETSLSAHDARTPPGATGNGAGGGAFGVTEPPHNNEARRRLHLPMAQGSDGGHGSEPVTGGGNAPNFGFGPGNRPSQRAAGWPPGTGSGRPGLGQNAPVNRAADPPARFGTPNPASPQRDRERDKESGAFIDQALRERVAGDITAFLAAFDTALAGDTPESRSGLREATDRLLRAGARTRIELERLEARAPLPMRDKNGQERLPLRR
ncbi:MAG: hypothetical protein ACREE2_09070 [Stellaceae bacterium]